MPFGTLTGTASWGLFKEFVNWKKKKHTVRAASQVLFGGKMKTAAQERAPQTALRVSSKEGCCVQLFVTPWTVARQAPLSMGFSRQEDWSELSLPPPGGLPDPGIKPVSPASAGGFFTTDPPGKSKVAVGKVNIHVISVQP